MTGKISLLIQITEKVTQNCLKHYLLNSILRTIRRKWKKFQVEICLSLNFDIKTKTLSTYNDLYNN